MAYDSVAKQVFTELGNNLVEVLAAYVNKHHAQTGLSGVIS